MRWNQGRAEIDTMIAGGNCPLWSAGRAERADFIERGAEPVLLGL